MTETMGSPAGGTPTTGGADSTRDVAKDEAQGVAQDAVQSGKATAETAKHQAGQVADEVNTQARQLFDQAREQLNAQGSEQKSRATGGLRSLADELSGLVHGEGTSNGMVADLARDASERVRSTADWLETHEPADVLAEARRFARRRPGTFLLGAAAAGFLGGRLTRGFADEMKEYVEAEDRQSGPTGPGAATAPRSAGVGTGMGSADPYATGVSAADPVHVATAGGGPAEPVAPGTRSGGTATQGLELPDEAPGTPGYAVPPTDDDRTHTFGAQGGVSGGGRL
jgi:hypothetical protein